MLNNIFNSVITEVEKTLNEYGWLEDSNDVPERKIDTTIKNELMKIDEDNYEELKTLYFDELDEMVHKELNKKYKVVYNNKEIYFYLPKYNFETVEELKKYFEII